MTFRNAPEIVYPRWVSGSNDPENPLPSSVALAAEKARAERIQRLTATLDRRIENPIATIDGLMAEAGEGAPRTELWEKLHAAALRDGIEDAVADAYTKCLAGPRMKRLPLEAQATILMHAADYFQGVRGDAAVAQDLLERVLRSVPGHPEAFGRLERRFEKLLDARSLLVLYASAAATPPKPATVLATQAYNRLLQIVGKAPLPDETCLGLTSLVAHHPRLLDALEAHCRATKRPTLACTILERALAETADADADVAAQRRQHLLELYLGEAGAPAEAIPHVEKLLERNPSDTLALKAAERLLGVREVASRAAAALQTARRSRAL